MATTEVWIPHGYGVQATPRRARKARWFYYLAEIPVRVEAVEAFENPRALVLSQDRPVFAPPERPSHWSRPKARKDVWSKGNREIGPSGDPGMERVSDSYGGHRGRIYRPLRPAGDRYGPLTVDRLLAGNRDAQFYDHPFLSKRERERFHLLEPRDDVANARMARIHIDNEEARAARIRETAGRLLLVGGELWRAEEMAFVVSLGDGGARPTMRLERPFFTSARSGIHFPLDRHDEARAFLESLAAAWGEATGKPAAPDVEPRFVSAVDPAFARIDGPTLTARSFGNAVHAAAMDARRGAAAPIAEAIIESLGGDRPYRSLHIVGNPFDFADRVEAWAEEALTLPSDGHAGKSELAEFSRRLRCIAFPIVHGRDKGLSAEADAAFFREEDFSGFDLWEDGTGDDAPAAPGP